MLCVIIVAQGHAYIIRIFISKGSMLQRNIPLPVAAFGLRIFFLIDIGHANTILLIVVVPKNYKQKGKSLVAH